MPLEFLRQNRISDLLQWRISRKLSGFRRNKLNTLEPRYGSESSSKTIKSISAKCLKLRFREEGMEKQK